LHGWRRGWPADRYLALKDRAHTNSGGRTFDAKAFAELPEEVRLRLLLRTINQYGHEGPAELGKVEVLLAALDRAAAEIHPVKRMKSTSSRLKQTLAGALISLAEDRIRIEPAPPRRRRK
jgi:tRNA(Ile)-lysidine synthase